MKILVLLPLCTSSRYYVSWQSLILGCQGKNTSFYIPAVKAFCLSMGMLHLNSRQSSLRSSWKIRTKFEVCKLMCCKKMTTDSPCSSCNIPSASSVVSYSRLLSCDFRFSILYKFIYKYRPCSWKKATRDNKVIIFSKSMSTIMVSIQLCKQL